MPYPPLRADMARIIGNPVCDGRRWANSERTCEGRGHLVCYRDAPAFRILLRTSYFLHGSSALAVFLLYLCSILLEMKDNFGWNWMRWEKREREKMKRKQKQ